MDYSITKISRGLTGQEAGQPFVMLDIAGTSRGGDFAFSVPTEIFPKLDNPDAFIRAHVASALDWTA